MAENPGIIPRASFAGQSAPTRLRVNFPAPDGPSPLRDVARITRDWVNSELEAAARQAAEDGRRAGKMAGWTGIPDEAPDTVRGRAFNAAAEETWAQRMQIEMRGAIDQAAFNHQANPAGLETEARATFEGLTKQLPPRLAQYRVDLDAAFRTALQPKINGARYRLEKHVADDRLATAQQGLAAIQRGYVANMQAAGLGDPDARLAAQQDFQSALVSLAALGPKEPFSLMGVDFPADPGRADALSVTQISRQMLDLREEGDFRAVLAAGEEAVSRGSGQAFLQALADPDGPHAKTLDADIRDRVAAKLTANMNRRKAEYRAAMADLDREYSQIDEAARLGIAPPQMLEGLRLRAQQAGHNKLAGQIERDSQDAELRAGMTLSSPQDQARILAAMQASRAVHGATDEQLAREQGLEHIHYKTLQGLQADPLGHAAKIQLVSLPPLDPAKSESLQARRQAMTIAEQHYNHPMPPLTQAEAKQFRDSRPDMAPPEQVAFLASLDTLGPGKALSAARQLDEANAALTGAAELARIDPRTAAMLLEGEKVLEGGKRVTPNSGEWHKAISSAIGNSVAPGQYAILEQQFRALYASQSARAGDYTGELSTERLKGVIKTRFGGGLLTLNGRKVLPPRDENGQAWTQNRFDDWLDSLSDDQLAAQGGALDADGTPVDLDTLRDDAVWITIRPGLYVPGLGDGENFRPFKAPDGTPVTLQAGGDPS